MSVNNILSNCIIVPPIINHVDGDRLSCGIDFVSCANWRAEKTPIIDITTAIIVMVLTVTFPILFVNIGFNISSYSVFTYSDRT